MKAKTKKELLELYYIKHGNFYDYSKFDIDNKVDNKVIIVCPVHGEFRQNHLDHIVAGCPSCGNQKKKQSQSKILVQDLNDLIAKLGDQFDFSHAIFKNTSSQLLVKCKKHSIFFKNTAHHIIRGAGCSDCKKEKISNKKRLGNDKFIKRAKAIQKKCYDYSLVEYKTLIDKVKIICSEHGIFEQKPQEHLRGYGCKLCAGTTISAVSQIWLDSFNLNLIREHTIQHDNGYYTVDGYDPKTNTVYEFDGDYWHGNPKLYDADRLNTSVDKKFGELYNNTILKQQTLKKLGYNLITIWESNFNAKISGPTNDQIGSKKTYL